MNRDSQKIQRVLVLHADKHQLEGIIEKQHPDVQVRYVESSEQVKPVLEAFAPEAVFSINDVKLPSESLRMAGLYPSVKWFHVGGSGIDRMLPWQSDYALMTNGAGVLSQYLAETVIGAILAMNNNMHIYRHQQMDRKWIQHKFKPLCDQTLLIVGLGAVGKKVADNAKALGMKVIATRQKRESYNNIDQLYSSIELENIIDQADFVSIHLPLSDDTTHLFNAQMISKMKNSACLVNTARGPVVEESALIKALTSGKLKAAYSDVFAQEPLAKDSHLWGLENLIITPHMADGVFGFEQKFLQFFSDNLQRWNNAEPLKNQLSFSDS